MLKLGKYRKNDKMSRLVCEFYPTLLVLSRFGIALGFGDKSIEEACGDAGVDADTFLAVVNLLINNNQEIKYAEEPLSTEALTVYLQNSHIYFLSYRFPGIREKLEAALESGQTELNKAVLRYFDEYVAQVHKHMHYEEKHVFPYIRELLQGKKNEKYNIAIFYRQHDQIEAKLNEFKQIIIKYYPAKSSNKLNSVLFDIFSCENDLASHNAIENQLLVPLITELENKIVKR